MSNENTEAITLLCKITDPDTRIDLWQIYLEDVEEKSMATALEKLATAVEDETHVADHR